jgi:large subunit ribosomal protein L14e
MVFQKFVEVGRAVLINYGPLTGRTAVIVDIINTARVLIEGPSTGVRRQEMSLRRLSMTDFVLDITRGLKSSSLKKVVDDFGLTKKFQATSYGKKLQRAATRSKLTDFDRFKVMVLRKKVNLYLHILFNFT